MLTREQMTQKLWDEKREQAYVLEPDMYFVIPNILPMELWIWRPESPNTLEYRWDDEHSSGFVAYTRPLSCIEMPGRVVKVLFRTDRPTSDFLRILMRHMESDVGGLDSFGFCGIEDEKQ